MKEIRHFLFDLEGLFAVLGLRCLLTRRVYYKDCLLSLFLVFRAYDAAEKFDGVEFQ